MKPLISGLLVFLFCMGEQMVWAQQNWTAVSDDRALEIAKVWAEKNERYLDITCKFKQVQHLDFMENPPESNGRFYFLPPGRIRWEFLEPEKEVLLFQGSDGRMIRNGKVRRIRGMNRLAGINELIDHAVKGLWDQLTDFDWALFENSNAYKIRFIPRTGRLEKHLARIELVIRKSSYDLMAILIYGEDQDYTEIRFSSHSYNLDLDPALFEW